MYGSHTLSEYQWTFNVSLRAVFSLEPQPRPFSVPTKGEFDPVGKEES